MHLCHVADVACHAQKAGVQIALVVFVGAVFHQLSISNDTFLLAMHW